MNRLRLGTVLTVVFGLLFGTGGSAAAHYVYNEGVIWQNGQGQCMEERTELSHGSGGGYTRTDLTANTILNTPYGSYHCTSPMNLASNYMAAKHQLEIWNGSNWAYCTSTDFMYRSTGGTSYPWVNERYWNKPCGDAYYYAWGLGWIYFDGAWRYGYLGSKDYHYLPA